MPTRGKNRGYSSESRTRHGWWHGRCCSRACRNDQCREGAIVGKYRRLIKTLKEARVGQIVLSGILPKMGGRGEEYRNCRRMVINTQVQKVCMEAGVGFIDMWLYFVGRGDFFTRDGFHLTGKDAAVLGCEFVRVVDEGINYLN